MLLPCLPAPTEPDSPDRSSCVQCPILRHQWWCGNLIIVWLTVATWDMVAQYKSGGSWTNDFSWDIESKSQFSLDLPRPPFPLGKLLLPVNQNSLTAFSTQWCTISPSPPLGFTKVMDFGNVCYLQFETSGLVSMPAALGQSTQDRTHSEVLHQLLDLGLVPWTTTF